MCKVKFIDPSMGYRSLADMRRVNIEDKDLFIGYITDRLGILSDSYVVHPIDEFIITYIIIDGKASGDRSIVNPQVYEVNVHNYNNYVLPETMNISDYGKIILENDVIENNQLFHRVVVINNKHTFIIDVYTLENGLIKHVEIGRAHV